MAQSTTWFYLFASPSEPREESPSTVFYRVEGESLAQSLCRLFNREYADAHGLAAFHHRAASSFSAEEQVLLDESLEWLDVYADPDPGIYEPPPSQHTVFLAQCAIRAQTWEQTLRGRTEPASQNEKPGSFDAAPSNSPTTDHQPEMPIEDWRNSGLILLWLLAQAYYQMLQSTISSASWFTALDTALNESYFWTVKNITNLLKNHEDLKDFPVAFEPLFPDLYPSTIGDLDWQDMVAPDAERFLSTVQQYVHSKGIYDPEKGTLAWIFIEMFRPNIDLAVDRAAAYSKRMRQYTQRARESWFQEIPSSSPEPPAKKKTDERKETMPTTKRDKVFISYSHKDQRFLDDLRAHLKPLERAGRVSAWSDKRIQPGSQWFDEIQKALASTKVAVLLVTKDFLASDFIHQHELGPLLKEAATGGVAIRWVLVRDCNWKNTPLKDYQAAFPTDKALAEMKAERDSAWVTVCQTIEAAANVP
ncbi:MAG: toll/interleukin-1 receptor domain-containing protein [Isosphaeraceae bacterium]